MHAMLEKLLWKSPIGQQIRSAAIRETEDREAQLRGELGDHEKRRDAALKQIADEVATLLPQLEAARADQRAAEENTRRQQHRIVNVLGNQPDSIHRDHKRATNAIQSELAELAKAKTQIDSGS